MEHGLGHGNVISGNASPASTTSAQGNKTPATDRHRCRRAAAIANGRRRRPHGRRHDRRSAAGAGNVISGNDGYGIYDHGANLIAGNLIGTDVSGTFAVPNDYPGFTSRPRATPIGGTTAGAGNVISGNIQGGIIVAASANLIEGNKIGTNAAGSAALANDGDGIDYLRRRQHDRWNDRRRPATSSRATPTGIDDLRDPTAATSSRAT